MNRGIEILIDGVLRIPAEELVIRATRSGGPGGQHVNKVSTRVELRFDVSSSPSLDASQRERLVRCLGSRLTASGELILSSDRYRSQIRNREEVIRRLTALLADALRPRLTRRRTRPPRSAAEKRLREKKHRGRTKRGREKPDSEE